MQRVLLIWRGLVQDADDLAGDWTGMATLEVTAWIFQLCKTSA